MEWEIPSFEQSLTWLNLSPIFPLGEIAKCRRVNRKTREINSSSEESEEDGEDGLEEPVEVEEDDDSHGGERKSDSDEDRENDHREEDGKDFNEKPKKKYGKGMKVLELFFWTLVDHFYRHNSKRYPCTYMIYKQICGRGCGEGGSTSIAFN